MNPEDFYNAQVLNPVMSAAFFPTLNRIYKSLANLFNTVQLLPTDSGVQFYCFLANGLCVLKVHCNPDSTELRTNSLTVSCPTDSLFVGD
ncbi:hypothetical protein Syn6312_1368 [Synechococcus sp. PCC 6312]|nr:hypothetical protein Syn6312_1368 [Synechococcus sp. PCC 6312]